MTCQLNNKRYISVIITIIVNYDFVVKNVQNVPNFRCLMIWLSYIMCSWEVSIPKVYRDNLTIVS